MRKITVLCAAVFCISFAAFAQGPGQNDPPSNPPSNITVKLRYDSITFIPDGPVCDEESPYLLVPITFSGFADEAMLLSEASINSICVNMEHSFLGDFTISIVCPNGQSATLKPKGGGGTVLGIPADASGTDFTNPCTAPPNIPGIGWTYCFSNKYSYEEDGVSSTYYYMNILEASSNNTAPTVPVSHPDFGNSGNSIDSTRIASGSHYYKPWDNFSSLIGCPLNGEWSLKIYDAWGIDNGFLFWWDMELSVNSSNGLADIDEQAIVSIYPNPAKEELTIVSDNKIETIEVFNLLGQNVYTAKVNGNNATINVTNFTKGSYVVKLHTDRGFTAKKFVVE
ncbi:MAG: T9SS type A sorting domain-containing protein [Bacteroidales bacterium]|nr:T9SS type A sorting domain-containing protein [Bacteroidales bacterium]